MLNKTVKLFINFFSAIIRHNDASLKYLYTMALKKETVTFFETDYQSTYPHIEKSCELIKKYDKQNALIIDVGAANATTAKLFRNFCLENSLILFEPLSENYISLDTFASQNKNVQVIKKAVGNKSGKIKITRTNRITSSSILPPSQNIEGEFLKDALIKKEEIEIDITRLDDEISTDTEIALLKIDVQGYELEVLRGATNTLKKTSFVTLELSNHLSYEGAPMYYDLDEYLRNNDFKLYDMIISIRNKGMASEWDAIYINKNLL